MTVLATPIAAYALVVLVAWLCWVPNLVVAEWWILRERPPRGAAIA